ncbi:MAG: hypothetical protein ACO3A4_11030 [Silvanigrellaceae bacterium]
MRNLSNRTPFKIPHVAGILACLGLSLWASANDVLRSRFSPPPFSEALRTWISTEVNHYNDELTLPFVGAENLHQANVAFVWKRPIPEEWKNKRMTVVLSNSGEKPVAKICAPGPGGQSSCSMTDVVESKLQPPVAGARVFETGPLELTLVNPRRVCRGGSQCEIQIPGFVIKNALEGGSPVLPRQLTLVTTASRLHIVDSERGRRLLSITSFPQNLSPEKLGKAFFFAAEHRGLMRIQFERYFLTVDLLAERGLLVGPNGQVWNGSLTADQSVWEEHVNSRSRAARESCSGVPLELNPQFVVYKNCVFGLGDFSNNLQGVVRKLTEGIDAAMQDDANSESLHAWSMEAGQLKIFHISLTASAAKQKIVGTLPFRGRNISELELFPGHVLRRTAFGHFLVGDQSETKTSLPFAGRQVVFSRDGKNALLAVNEKSSQCRWKHLVSKHDSPLHWGETGLEFPCSSSTPAATGEGLSVTTLVNGKFEVTTFGRRAAP